MFTFASNLSNGVRLWIVEKGAGAGGFYDGGSTTVNIFDPDAASGAPFFLSFALQPAHMFGTPPAGVGTFLVMYDGITDGVNEALRVIRVDDPTGTP
ncbi:MAG: hypothetical protein GTO62_00650, partial [Planctomycetales bacterium]|nr:hypothetical protein [Planctomycetales bacterium]